MFQYAQGAHDPGRPGPGAGRQRGDGESGPAGDRRGPAGAAKPARGSGAADGGERADLSGPVRPDGPAPARGAGSGGQMPYGGGASGDDYRRPPGHGHSGGQGAGYCAPRRLVGNWRGAGLYPPGGAGGGH